MKIYLKSILRFILLLLILLDISCSHDDRNQLEVYLENGQTSYDSGFYNEAIQTWEKALKLFPSNSDLKFRLAKAHQHLAQFDTSTKYLQQVIGNNDKSIDAYFMMVQNEIFVGDFEAAKSIISKKLETMFPEHNKTIMLKGDIATFLGQFEEGEAYYRRAIKLDNNHLEAHFKLAANLLVQGKEESADNHFRLAIDTKKQSSVKYWLHRAEYQAIKGDIKSAEAAMRQALQIQPNSFFIKLKIVQLLFAYKKYDAMLEIFGKIDAFSSENKIIQKAFVEALLNTNRLEQAHSIIQEQNLSDDFEWLLLAGKHSLLQGSYTHAISCFEQVLTKRRDDPNASYMLAMAYLSAGRENLAIQTLIRLLTISPDMVEAELALASIYFKKAQYDLSIDYLQRVINKVPDNPRLYVMIGNCRLVTGKYDEAENSFKKALTLAPDSMSAQYYLALVKEKNGQANEAIQLYRSILVKAPHMADVGLRLADLLIREKRTEEAVDIFRSLVDNQPENGYLKFMTGHIYHELKQLQKASRYYRLAIDDNPELIQAYEKLTEIEPDNQQKIDILRNAIKKRSNSTELKMILANCYFNEGKLDLAIDVMKNLYQLDPQNTAVANNLSWLYLEKEINLNDAYELASAAFEKEPENPFYAHTLGFALYKKGIFKQAEWYLNEAIRLIERNKENKPGFNRHKAIFSYHLALSQMETDNEDKALEELRFAVDLGLPQKYKDHALQILGK